LSLKKGQLLQSFFFGVGQGSNPGPCILLCIVHTNWVKLTRTQLLQSLQHNNIYTKNILHSNLKKKKKLIFTILKFTFWKWFFDKIYDSPCSYYDFRMELRHGNKTCTRGYATRLILIWRFFHLNEFGFFPILKYGYVAVVDI